MELSAYTASRKVAAQSAPLHCNDVGDRGSREGPKNPPVIYATQRSPKTVSNSGGRGVFTTSPPPPLTDGQTGNVRSYLSDATIAL